MGDPFYSQVRLHLFPSRASTVGPHTPSPSLPLPASQPLSVLQERQKLNSRQAICADLRIQPLDPMHDRHLGFFPQV